MAGSSRSGYRAGASTARSANTKAASAIHSASEAVSAIRYLGAKTPRALPRQGRNRHQTQCLLSPVLHAALAFLRLLAATTLAVYKPRGMAPYGRRKRRERRTPLVP